MVSFNVRRLKSMFYPHPLTHKRGGRCTIYPNTASFTTDTGKTGSAGQSVTVCVGADLTVSKTATPSFTRTYNWSILKTVDPAAQTIPASKTGTFNYTVTVTEKSFTH